VLAGAVMAMLGLLAGLAYAYYNARGDGTPDQPREAVVVVPEGFVKDDDPKTEQTEVYNKQRYSRIRYRLAGTGPLVFLLIPHTKAQNLPAFYISQDKVTRGQFAAMLANPRFEQLLKKYDKHSQDGQWSTLKRTWEKPGWNDPAKAQYPVLDITPTEAHCFAECLGGRLPLAQQWDKAGGCFDNRRFPCDEQQWKQRKDYEPVGSSLADESLFHCRDMSGNGREWVRDVFPQGSNRFVPLEDPRPEDWVERRGNSPKSPVPFCFDQIPNESRPYDTAQPDTGFRVVVEID
jgi:formylglycine-generating enzyme required for sulfatase activity